MGGRYASAAHGFCPAAPTLDPWLPTSYAGLLAWYEAPPKSLIATPSAYVTLTLPSIGDYPVWSSTRLTRTGGQADPDGGTNGSLWTDSMDGAGTTHLIQSGSVANSVNGRTTHLDTWVKAGTKDVLFIQPGGGAGIYFRCSTQTFSNATGGATGTVLATSGAWSKVSIQAPLTGAASGTIYIGQDPPPGVTYTGAGTGTFYTYSPAIVQDGVVNTALDLRTRWPGIYRSGGGPAIDPSTGLPYEVYDATQATFANCPHYRGSLSAQWSTGAPTIYNPGNASGISLALASGLVSKLAGSGTPFEVIALLKLFGASATNDSALLRLIGATAKARMISQKGATGKWGRYRVDDGTAHTDDTAFTDSGAAEEVLVRHVFSGSSDKFYKGAAAPLTADASNPLASTAINCSFTSGQIFYNAGASALAMSMRGMWIRTPSTDADADAIAAGMLARSAATA